MRTYFQCKTILIHVVSGVQLEYLAPMTSIQILTSFWSPCQRKYWLHSSYCALEAGATHVDTSVLGSKYFRSIYPYTHFLGFNTGHLRSGRHFESSEWIWIDLSDQSCPEEIIYQTDSLSRYFLPLDSNLTLKFHVWQILTAKTL